MLDLTDRPSAPPDFGRFGSTEATIAATKRPKSARKPSRCSSHACAGRRTRRSRSRRCSLRSTPRRTGFAAASYRTTTASGQPAARGGGCVPFSVCDNPDIASRPTYESALNKISDHATKDRLPYDNWDFVEVNDTAVYNRFDRALHLVTGLRARAYDPSRPPITLVALLPFVSVHIQKKSAPRSRTHSTLSI